MTAMKAKVILLGDGAVGKTSLIRRFVTDQFSDTYLMTVGTKVTKKELDVGSGAARTPMVMTIWDVLGQKGYAGVQETAVKGGQAVLMVYDATRDETWKALEEYWIPLLWRLVGKVPIVFAGNKLDQQKDVGYAKDVLGYLEQRYDAKGFLSSAKTGENVEGLFLALGAAILANLEEPIERVAQPTPPGHAVDPLVAVADKIMTDFCADFGGLETAMNVVRQQFEKAKIDVRAPTKDGLLKVIDYLSEVEKKTKAPGEVAAIRLRRITWVKAVP